MGRYSRESDNVAKSCKARGPNLRVHFKVRILPRNPRSLGLLDAQCPQLKSVNASRLCSISLLHCC